MGSNLSYAGINGKSGIIVRKYINIELIPVRVLIKKKIPNITANGNAKSTFVSKSRGKL